MDAIFGGLGVDYAQWLALTRALLKRDFRTRGRSVGRPGRHVTGATALLYQTLFYSIFGALLSVALVVSPDIFLVGTLLCTYVMFMSAVAVLLDHSSALTASDDYAVIGYRPVSSRTYFAVRVTNVLVYTLLLTTMVVYIPVGVLFVKKGMAAGFAGIAALYGSSIAISFLLLVSYSALTRLVGPDRLKNALSYVQLLMSFGVYGGYFLLSRVASQVFLKTYVLAKGAWIFIAPPAWFGSYFDLARGDYSFLTVAPAVVSVAAILGLLLIMGGWLASGFADVLADASVSAAPKAAGPGRATKAGWLFREGESRAMALLIRSQFRNDQKFRMGVLAIVPLTILYIFQGVTRTGAGSERPGGEFMLVGFAIMMFPAMLKMQLTRSDSYRASWVFFASPVSRATLIRSAKNVVVAMFLLPYLALVALVMAYVGKDPLHAFVHVLLLGLISHLVLQLTILLDPELPFAKPNDKGGGPARLMGLLIAIGVINAVLSGATSWLYTNWLAVGAIAGVTIVLSVFVDLLTKARIEEQARNLEFVG